MRGRSTRFAVFTCAIVVALVGASVAAAAPSRVPQQAASGTIRIAAEEEPTCADWIASCAGSSWGNWALGNLTLPQALNVNADGEYVPGAILVDLPTLEPGPPMKVTYRIRPEAVWSDGEPITSKDFEYTWKQVVTSKDIYDTTGYIDIESIDTSDPTTAVVTFSKPVALWRDLFGGFYFLLPSHLLEGKSRSKAMKDGYAFSAGPWKLDGGKAGWKKGKTITLVPNGAFWGTKPSIGKAIFQFIPESSAELEAVKTGQVVAAYPLPIDGALDQLDESPSLTYTVSFGNQYDGFWINAKAFPLDSKSVRQAVAYATDRQVIVDQILRPAIRQGRVLQSFIVPTFRQFYVPAFEEYTPQPDRVDELMTGDGWKKGSDGIWAKGGKKASFEINSTAGNESRALTEQIWQSQLRESGFDLKIKNLNSDVLFGSRLPKGQYDVALYASVGTPDPGLCTIFCSNNIPSKKNKNVGNNTTWTNDPTIDRTWSAVDTTLEDAARVTDTQEGQAALAEYVASIPLYQAPEIFIYNHDRLGGNLQDNVVMGPFFTMNEWVLK
ncbi:MAG TPA: ABC transporter substrate-binding protein [Acidimicrobiia bacterium]